VLSNDAYIFEIDFDDDLRQFNPWAWNYHQADETDILKLVHVSDKHFEALRLYPIPKTREISMYIYSIAFSSGILFVLNMLIKRN